MIERLSQSKQALACIEKSQEIAEKSLAETIRFVRPQMTERQVANFLTKALLDNGADSGNFGIVVASGSHAADPHAVPDDRELEWDSFLLIDFGAIYRGFYSDISRTVALGNVSAEMRTVYEIVLEANCQGIENIRAGRKAKEVDSVTRSVIEKEGYGQYFTHGTGHGVGREIHEPPFLRRDSTDYLQEGDVVTVEPGIYLPGRFGVRIEDLVLVTDSGYRNLTKFNKQLITI